MRPITVIIILSAILASCKFFNSTETNLELTPFQQYRNGRINKMAFVNKDGFSYKTKSGIRLNFPPNIFECGSDDSINLEVSEYTTLSEMVLAGLSTMSGEKQLESNGMLYCKALNQKLQEVKVKAGKSYKISFPNKSKSTANEFMLFEGKEENGVVNWINPKPSKKNSKTRNKPRNQTKNGNRQIEKPALTIGAYGIQNEMDLPENIFSFQDTTKPFLIDYFLDRYALPLVNDLFPLSPNASFLLFFDLLPNGKLKFRGSDKGLNPAMIKSLSNFFENMPNMNPSGISNESSIPIFLNILPNKLLANILKESRDNQEMLLAKKAETEAKNAEEEAEKKQIIQQQIDEEEKRLEKIDKSYKFNKTVENALSLVFFADQFGWINCDRFLGDQGEKSIIAFDGLEVYQNYRLQLVFPDIKSIFRVLGKTSLEISENQKVVILFSSQKFGTDSIYYFNTSTIVRRKDLKIKIEPEVIKQGDFQKRLESYLVSTKFPSGTKERTRRP
jgi:hypothetical protein